MYKHKIVSKEQRYILYQWSASTEIIRIFLQIEVWPIDFVWFCYHNFASCKKTPSGLYRSYFSNSAASIASFVNLAIAETNQGYANSQVPITLALHCILDSNLAAQNSFSSMISGFYNSACIENTLKYLLRAKLLCIPRYFFWCKQKSLGKVGKKHTM